jgi:2-amino-4-hydroxy-6-hydroxymethyldihydropteridine diphosphokinase
MEFQSGVKMGQVRSLSETVLLSDQESMLPEANPATAPSPKGSPRGKQVYLSLGSNRGDRMSNLLRAMDELGEAGVKVQRVSSYYKTEPVDFGPQAWFLNCAMEATTELMPMQLLKAVKSVERALGRRPGVNKGPRPIDIDILLYENVVVRTAALTIPHERMNERRFVLIPLRELAPAVRHPVSRRTVTELLQTSPDLSQVVRYKPEE